jgi:hypothetical protein
LISLDSSERQEGSMIRFMWAFALAAATLAAPAAAQELWRHEASGISIPRRIGEMRLNQERDASGGGGYDIILQYGEGPTAVTLYVYRSAYPNPALWFERTRMAMSSNVGAPSENVAPDSFTLGNASSPNGLREDIAIPAGGPFRATSVAIAQVGEWIVKARVSSQRLGPDQVAARMTQLLGALRFDNMPAPHPLALPAACGDTGAMRGRRIADAAEAVAAAARNGSATFDEARGRSGLAADPSGWCRETTGIPAQYGTVYRRRDGAGWVALLGDAGRAISAARFEPSAGGGAATYVSIPASTNVAALYDALPPPEAAVEQALPILVGQAEGLAEVPRR